MPLCRFDVRRSLEVSVKSWGYPKFAGWVSLMENPIKMDDLGVPLIYETTRFVFWGWTSTGKWFWPIPKSRFVKSLAQLLGLSTTNFVNELGHHQSHQSHPIPFESHFNSAKKKHLGQWFPVASPTLWISKIHLQITKSWTVQFGWYSKLKKQNDIH